MVLNRRVKLSLEELAMKAKNAAIQAKDDSLNSQVRQQALLDKQTALSELMGILMERIQTEIPKTNNISLSDYIYEETLQNVLIYISTNIHKYQPESGCVMSWVFFLLNRRKNNVFKWLNWNGKVTYKSEGRDKYGDEYDIDFIETYQPPNVNPLPSEKLMAFIKEDPEGLLANKLFNHNPRASFQTILLKKVEEDKSWKEITEELELGNTHGPIYCFYQRCCKEFTPYFQKYLWS